MMGTKLRAFAPLTNISVDDLVPTDHFYRHVERTLDLSFVRDLVRPCYATGGRPSIDPVVFFKIQLTMFFEGMRSERQVMRVAADRLSVRWYLGYDLHEPLPDHSSLTRIRDRYGVTIFRRFFDAIVEQCREAGLVWGEELYFDSTQVEANADRDKRLPRFYVEAITDHLDALFPPGDSTVQQVTAGAPAPNLRVLPVALPPDREAALAATNAARHDWIADVGRPNRAAGGSYQRQSDVWVNTTDPDATMMHKKGGGSALGYHTHYAVDGGKARIILAALVTPSEVMDNQPMQDLLWHVCFRWHLQPTFACGDATYGTLENIVALERAGIRAYTRLRDFDGRTPGYGKQLFTYEAAHDLYRCPAGAPLTRRATTETDGRIRYEAAGTTCRACPRKADCTTSDHGRRVYRHVDEGYVDLVRSYHRTEAYKKAMRKRQVWVEPLFGEGKAWHGMGRFRLRQQEKVNSEALMLASGQNLKRLLSWRGWGRRGWPGGAASVVLPGMGAVLS